MSRRWLPLPVCVLSAVIGCGQLLGTDEYHARAGSDGGTRIARITFGNAACGQCSVACADEIRQCESDPTCAVFAACFLGCPAGDGACQGRCVDDAPAKPAAFRGIMGCLARACAAECTDCTTFFALLGGEACGVCVGQSDGPGGMCDKTKACLDDAGCRAFSACLSSECRGFDTDPACRLVCGSRHPEGARFAFQGIGGQYFQSCPTECGAGQQWDCNPASWPGLEPGSARAILRGVPAGATVRACALGDPACNRPVLPLAADAGDAVTFELPRAGTAEAGYYFEVVPPTPARPYLLVPGVPLLADTTWWVFTSGLDGTGNLGAAITARGETLDLEQQGIVEAWVVDCVGGLGDYRQLTPTLTATVAAGSAAIYNSDASLEGYGIAQFINVPPPSTSVEIRRNGTPLGRAQVPIRAGATTYVFFNHPQFF